MDKNELSKYIKNLSLLQDNPPESKTFHIDIDNQGNGSYSLDFEYNCAYDYFSWINYIHYYKQNEIEDFLNNVKNNKLAVWDNIDRIHEENSIFYYDDYPHQIISVPQNAEKVRFIVVEDQDYDNDEGLLTDIIVDKTLFISEWENAYYTINRSRSSWGWHYSKNLQEQLNNMSEDALQVLDRFMLGLDIGEIATNLSIEITDVENYLCEFLEKTDCKNFNELKECLNKNHMYVYKRNIISPDWEFPCPEFMKTDWYTME